MAWIVFTVQEFDGQWAVPRHLRDVLTRLGTVKMMSAPRKYDDAARSEGFQCVRIVYFAAADIEDTGDDCVDSILMVHVRHEFRVSGYLDTNNIRAGNLE